jgi:drug/metabolite transporter (DMT)-like permease
MTIGGSIALIVLGAILAFAVEFDVAGLSISTIGIILMIGGLVGLVFGLAFVNRGTTATRTVRRTRPVDTVVEERDVI